MFHHVFLQTAFEAVNGKHVFFPPTKTVVAKKIDTIFLSLAEEKLPFYPHPLRLSGRLVYKVSKEVLKISALIEEGENMCFQPINL